MIIKYENKIEFLTVPLLLKVKLSASKKELISYVLCQPTRQHMHAVTAFRKAQSICRNYLIIMGTSSWKGFFTLSLSE